MNRQPEDLQEQIEALKNKTEQNRKMAREANELADAALKHFSDSEQVSFKSLPSSTSCRTRLLQQPKVLNSRGVESLRLVLH